MNTLTQGWAQLLEQLQDIRVLVVLAVAIAAFLFAWGVIAVVSWAADPARRRLEALGGTRAELNGSSMAAAIAALVQPVARYVMPSNGKERDAMQEKFIRAGLYSPAAMPVFYGVKTALAVLLFIGWMFASNLLPRLSSGQVWFYAAAAAFVGLTLPNFVLNRMVERRQRRLRNAFPDALDLLIVCVEAGLGLAAALQRVAGELEVSHPELAAELERVNAEMQAGVEREQALRNLAARTGLDDIRGLVGLLVQTMRFGTSIADALRVYAEEFRDKRTQKAEELAAKLGTKMIFPMIFCFFPSFFLVALGPAVIRLVQAFGHAGTH
jgi:tight adherence protein C